MNKKILIVDNDPKTLTFMKQLVSKDDIELLVARDGLEGIKLFQLKKPSLIILELDLPKLDGYQVCKQIKNSRKGKDIPVIVISNQDNNLQKNKKKLQDCGATEFLVKPLNQKIISDQINNLFASEQSSTGTPHAGGRDGKQKSVEKLPNEGNLDDIPFPQLLMNYRFNKLTGVLTCNNGGMMKSVYFKSGFPVYALSNVTEDSLSFMLLKAGKISKSQYQDMLDLKKETGGMEKGLLLKFKLVGLKELPELVKQQVEMIIQGLFLWVKGQYSFVEDETFIDRVTVLELNYLDLVRKGIALIKTDEPLNQILPESKVVLIPKKPAKGFPEAMLEHPGFKSIHTLINGKRTLGEILRQSLLNRFNSKKIVAFMIVVGLISIKDPDEPDDPQPSKKEQYSPKQETVVVTTSKDTEIDMSHISPEKQEMWDLIQTGDFYKILGISKKATLREIKKTYFKLAKLYHPDSKKNISSKSGRDIVGKIFAGINEAYDVLSTPAKRKQYDASLSSPKAKKIMDPKQEAEEFFKKGDDMVQRGMIMEAFDYLKRAVFLDPENDKYLHAYAKMLLKTGNSEYLHEAKSHCLQAISINKKNAAYYVTLGLIYKTANILSSAKRQFETALKYDPNNTRAKKELDNLQKSS